MRCRGRPLQTLTDLKETLKFQPCPAHRGHSRGLGRAGERVQGRPEKPESNPHLSPEERGSSQRHLLLPEPAPCVPPGRGAVTLSLRSPGTARTRADGEPAARAGPGYAWPKEKRQASEVGNHKRRAEMLVAGTWRGLWARTWGSRLGIPISVVRTAASGPSRSRGGRAGQSPHRAAMSRGLPQPLSRPGRHCPGQFSLSCPAPSLRYPPGAGREHTPPSQSCK